MGLFAVSGFAQGNNFVKPVIFIKPAAMTDLENSGFETFITAAFTKKKTPAVIVTDESKAAFILESVIIAKEESTGSKIARCLFAYCAGMEGKNTASVRLIKIEDGSVTWAYNVKKGGAKNFQSSSEAIAKHLKNFIEKNQDAIIAN
jgi:hypothetical protein